MTTTLRVLLVEDNDDDAFLMTRALRRGGMAVDIERVETREAYIAALDRGQCDIVISDYYLPSFGGIEALAILRSRSADFPFILVSGTIGEEIAVESIHAGADDYLLKQNLVRLVPAVRRAIRETAHRQQREAAEKALVESRERLELIFNSVSDVLVFISLDENNRWRYKALNKACLKKLESVGLPFSAEDLLEREAHDTETNLLKLDAGSVAWFAEMREHVRAHRTAQTAERRFVFPTGIYSAEFSFIPSLDSSGEVRHIVIDVRDTTMQRRAEQYERELTEKMNQLQRLESIGTLASGVAHDFNNLLTGILGFAELANSSQDSAEIKQHCGQIVKISQQARDLIRRILTFARPTPAKHGSIPFGESIRDLMPLVRSSIPNNVTVDVQMADSAVHVGIDTDQLLQVLLNLVTNATQAMPEGGKLVITADVAQLAEPIPAELYPLRPGEHVKLVVTDTGLGIPAEILPRIFDPFFTTKPAGQGTGIGLAMVHQIVQSRQGAIRVTSVPQQGTTFEIYLPVVKPAASISNEAQPPVPEDEPCTLAVDGKQSLDHLEARKEKLIADLTKVENEREQITEYAGKLTGALAKTKSELAALYEHIRAMRNEVSEIQARISASLNAH